MTTTPLSAKAARRSWAFAFSVVGVVLAALVVLASVAAAEYAIVTNEEDNDTAMYLQHAAAAVPADSALQIMTDSDPQSSALAAINSAFASIRTQYPSIASIALLKIDDKGARYVASNPARSRGAPFEIQAGLTTSLFGTSNRPQTVGTFINHRIVMPLRLNGNFVGALAIEPKRFDLNSLTIIIACMPAALIVLTTILFVALLTRVRRKQSSVINQRVDDERLALLELATHQLGAPLATFRWWLEILKSPDANTMDPKDVYTEVSEAVNRMDSIIKSLESAQKIDMRQLSTTLGTISSPRHIILDAVHALKTDLELKEMQVKIDVAENLKPIRMDPVKITAVLGEIIGNAISFSPAKSTINVSVSFNEAKNTAQFEVRDSGIGVPANELPRIFEKFYRASNAPQAKTVGNGLGLFNARGVIEQLGGEVWIKSKEHEGTSVFFTLPFEDGKKK